MVYTNTVIELATGLSLEDYWMMLLNRNAVDSAIDVEHDDGAETFGVVLHRKFHVMFDIFVFDFLKWIQYSIGFNNGLSSLEQAVIFKHIE